MPPRAGAGNFHVDVFMNGRVALILLAFIAAVAVVLADGINGKAAFIFSFVAVLIGISWFFRLLCLDCCLRARTTPL